jgi:hypothetical protein
MRWRYSMRLFAILSELWLARGDSERATEFGERCLDFRTNSRKNLAGATPTPRTQETPVDSKS